MTDELRILNDRIFGGTTCIRSCWVEDIPGTDFVLAHHGSHASYLNRFSGSVTCESYHVPVLRIDSNKSWYVNYRAEPMCVGGRLSKEKKAEIIEWCKKQSKGNQP